MKKLNMKGFSHELVVIAFVVIFAIAGVGYLVASRAATPNPNHCTIGGPNTNAPAPNTLGAIYEYNDGPTGDHFYTQARNDSALAAVGYCYSNVITGYAYSNQIAGTTALYEYWNPVIRQHFYTTAPYNVEPGATDKSYGWKRTVAYVSPTKVTNTTPLYRILDTAHHGHYYTTNVKVLLFVLSNKAFHYEGIQGYLWVTGSGTPAPSTPMLGAEEPTSSYATLASEGFKQVVIVAGWNEIEPSQGQFSSTAISNLQSQINSAAASGLNVSLDIGVQYAPDWVFSVGGGTYFTDQYGDKFQGNASSGNNVPNAFTDNAVRSIEATYLQKLGTLQNISSVRLGGGPWNELRYPSNTDGPRGNAYWFYDSSSQALLPANTRGWVPGTGTITQATNFMNAYNQAEVNFGEWLINQASNDFASNVKLQLLLPGWGERPGQVSTAENNLLQNTPNEVNSGLDWTDLLPALASNSRVVAWTTWADAMTGDSSNPDPADYLHSILPTGMLTGGEATGVHNSTNASMNLMFSDAHKWNWWAATWQFSGQTQTDQQVVQAFLANGN